MQHFDLLFMIERLNKSQVTARWARLIIKLTQEKRACHEIQIQPKEIKVQPRREFKKKPKMQFNMYLKSLYGLEIYMKSLSCFYKDQRRMGGCF